MTIKLTFLITLESDYHISAGHGLASEADSALLRDADGVPILRGTNLTGLLRDGLWRLLQLEPLQDFRYCQASGRPEVDAQGRHYDAYCGQFHEQELCPICQVFGTPRRPKRWRIHSARPVGQTSLHAGPQSTLENRQLVHRARIDPRTRRAEPRKLFTQEDGDQTLTFKFTVTCLQSDTATLDEAALLVAAARFVRQLGHSRRRGQGECLITVDSVSGLPDFPDDGVSAQQALLDHFEARWLKREQIAFAVHPIDYTLHQSGEHTRFRMIVRTDEPLLIAQHAEAGNRFESRPVIPGVTLRGAFAWRAAYRNRFNDSSHTEYRKTDAYNDFIQIFLRNGVYFPYLYPAYYEERTLYPTVPIPLDWLTCKDFPSLSPEAHGAAQAKDNAKQRCPKCGAPTRVMEGFICLKNVRSEYMPTMCNEMHIRIDNENSRVAPGDLFAYVALSAGQYFIGELHAEDTVAWQKFSALTGIQEQTLFTLHLGRANRRGYGRVTAWLQPLNADYDKRPHTWVQLKLRRRVSSIPSHESPVTLTLLTDTIVQDTWGRYALGFEDWLVNYLSQRQLPVTIQDIFVKQRLVDGFNGHLGLPRQRQVAIAAGSVAYLAQKPDTTWPDDWQTRLAQLEYDGIGLRRSEGFGQFAFNHPLYQRDRTIRRSAIRLQDLSEDLPLRSELATPFREIWERFLDEQTTALAELCKEPPFSAVARWLHSKQKESPATLKEQLLKLGEPSVCLLKGIKREEKSQSCTEQDEYGEREKRNRLIQKREHLSDPEKREQEALGILYMILERLEAESSTNWPMGIVMLADRLASVVDNEGDEK